LLNEVAQIPQNLFKVELRLLAKRDSLTKRFVTFNCFIRRLPTFQPFTLIDCFSVCSMSLEKSFLK
jgi:hypothetical protein